MQTSRRTRQAGWLAVVIIGALATSARSTFAGPQAPGSPDVSVVNGGAGGCTADFVVSDASGKGIYAAKIEIRLQYGFMGLHKLGVTVTTNYDGKARIEGLPEKIKKTAEFKVSRGEQNKTFVYDPVTDCHPRHEVTLGEK